jgi:hypothetical protein
MGFFISPGQNRNSEKPLIIFILTVLCLCVVQQQEQRNI